MNLKKLYKMQEKLDNHILEDRVKRTGEELGQRQLLEKTILALLTEVGEFSNATRCFKYWSTKGSESKERILDELADIWHFYLSVGNQISCKLTKKYFVSEEQYDYVIGDDSSTEIILISLFHEISTILVSRQSFLYYKAGGSLYILGKFLGFTNEEVEQAYLKKHEENYRRQREGY